MLIKKRQFVYKLVKVIYVLYKYYFFEEIDKYFKVIDVSLRGTGTGYSTTTVSFLAAEGLFKNTVIESNLLPLDLRYVVKCFVIIYLLLMYQRVNLYYRDRKSVV